MEHGNIIHFKCSYFEGSMRVKYCLCNSVETAQPGDRTTNPGIVMPECYASSQRVDTLARVVITPVRHTHTRLHTPLSNICSSPSSLQHTRGLTCPTCLLPQPYPQCSVLKSGLLVLHYRQGEPLLGANVTVLKLPSPGTEPPTLAS